MAMAAKSSKAGSAKTAPKTSGGKNSKSKNSNSKQKGLEDLFEHALKDMYYAEKKIHKALPKMIKAAADAGLKQGLTSHREETAGQIEKIEEIFALLGKKPKGEKCDAIDGILEEGQSLLEDFADTKAGDAAIIFSCQAVEHYEITRYGSMHAYATVLEMKQAAKLIEAILRQEKAADGKLTDMAEARINDAASID